MKMSLSASHFASTGYIYEKIHNLAMFFRKYVKYFYKYEWPFPNKYFIEFRTYCNLKMTTTNPVLKAIIHSYVFCLLAVLFTIFL